MSRFRTSVVVGLVVLICFPGAAAGDEEQPKNPLRVFYDQGFRLTSNDGRFALRLNGLLQIRYTFVDYDPLVRFNQEDYSNFFVRRARLYFTGHAGDPRFTYIFHIQLEPNQGINANDLWVEYEFSDLVRVGAGRIKVPYGLEFMNAGWALGMVERSVFSGETDIDLGSPSQPGPRYPGGLTARFGLSSNTQTGFATGGMNLYRSQGVLLRGHRGSGTSPTFEYQAGLWQGRGTTGLSNSGNGHLASLRVGYHPWGFVDWREVGDPDKTPSFKLGVLASAYTNSSDDVLEFSEAGYNLAAMVRCRGWSVDAEWGRESYDYDLFEADFDREGWRASVGWFVLARKLELRARVAEIVRLADPSAMSALDSGLGLPELRQGDDWGPALEASISEVSAAVNWILPGWRNRLTLDGSRLVREFAADPDAVINGEARPIAKAPDQIDYRVRAMVQLVF